MFMSFEIRNVYIRQKFEMAVISCVSTVHKDALS